MARRRDTTTLEDLKGLERLEKEYQGRPEAARITMLRLLRDEPNRSINDIALQIGYSVPTVKRWMKIYRSEGLDALVQIGARGRQDEGDEGLEKLSKKMAAGDFSSLAEVRQWMERQDAYGNGTAVNGSAERGTLTASGRGKKGRAGERTGAIAGDHEHILSGVVIPEKVFKFLNSIPTTHVDVDWIKQFRAALQEFLGDVDRITMTVSVHRNVINPPVTDTLVSFRKDIPSGEWVLEHVDTDVDGEDYRLRFLMTQLQPTFPHDNYHPPKAFVFYYRDQFYMGGMILWRNKELPPISEQTLAVVELLKPFLAFLYSDLAARHQLNNPLEAMINEVLGEITTAVDMTLQERRILLMQLLGFNYEKIAEELNISINTVRSHVKSLYVKTGAHGPAQFFAKYFAPKLKKREP